MFKNKKSKVLLMISTVLLFLTVMSFSPEFVIRLNLLLRLHPIQSLTVSIEDRGYDYSYQCYMYRVSGYDPYEWFVPDEFKGSAGDFWYVKKLRLGYIMFIEELIIHDWIHEEKPFSNYENMRTWKSNTLRHDKSTICKGI